jgi:hypothetical protein
MNSRIRSKARIGVTDPSFDRGTEILNAPGLKDGFEKNGFEIVTNAGEIGLG